MICFGKGYKWIRIRWSGQSFISELRTYTSPLYLYARYRHDPCGSWERDPLPTSPLKSSTPWDRNSSSPSSASDPLPPQPSTPWDRDPLPHPSASKDSLTPPPPQSKCIRIHVIGEGGPVWASGSAPSVTVCHGSLGALPHPYLSASWAMGSLSPVHPTPTSWDREPSGPSTLLARLPHPRISNPPPVRMGWPSTERLHCLDCNFALHLEQYIYHGRNNYTHNYTHIIMSILMSHMKVIKTAWKYISWTFWGFLKFTDGVYLQVIYNFIWNKNKQVM